MLSGMSIVAMSEYRNQTKVMDDFGRFLASRREAAGYRSQTAFAEAIGKGSSWVSRLERGAAKELPPPEDVALLARHLGVTQAELVSSAGYDIETGTEGDSEAVSAVRAILGDREFTEKQIGQLTRQIRGLVEMLEG